MRLRAQRSPFRAHLRRLETRSSWRAPLAPALAGVDWTALRDGATTLGRTVSSGSGQPQLLEQILASNVQRQVVTSEAIDGELVVTTALENGSIATQSASDAAGQVRWSQDGAGHVTQLGYDALGRLSELTLPDGARHRVRYDGYDWQLDPRGHVSAETITFNMDTWARTHEYDARGFLTRSQDAGGTSTSSYDAIGLPSSMSDMSGERTIARGARSISAGPGRSYDLDAAGRVIAQGGLTLTWGPTGEIDEATRGGRTWTYLYDEAGQRIAKLENGEPVAGYVGAVYLAPDHAVVPVKLDGHLVGLWKVQPSGNTFELVATDSAGTLLSDGGTANLATPYGMRAQRPARSAALDFVERGYDADLGTVRFGVRDYDPALGQFWSPDPLFLESADKCAESPVECNLYGYAKGNPLSWTDPSGQQSHPRAFAGRMGAIVPELNKYEVDKQAVAEIAVATFVSAVATAACGGNPACALVGPMIFASNEEEVGGAVLTGAVGALGSRAKIYNHGPKKTDSLPRLPRSLGAAANIEMRNRIGESSYAKVLMKNMSQQSRREADTLVERFAQGNNNPGIGTRALGGDFYELRGRNAGRVIIKKTSDGMYDVVGKFQGHALGDIANSRIIRRLTGDYTAAKATSQ